MPSDFITPKFNEQAAWQEQKRLAFEEEERKRQIENLKRREDRAQLHELIRARDENEKIEKERARRTEEELIRNELQKRARMKDELHLAMQGIRGKDPKQIEQEVRQQIRAGYRAEIDQPGKDLLAQANRLIDQELSAAQVRQREQEQAAEKLRQMQENGRQISNPKRTPEQETPSAQKTQSRAEYWNQLSKSDQTQQKPLQERDRGGERER